MAVQERILGSPCPILACAVMNHLDYCMRDCGQFPCGNFKGGYPFSQGFLDMQERRLKQWPPAFTPDGVLIQIPQEYWNGLAKKDIIALCNFTLGNPAGQGKMILRHLNLDVCVDIGNRRVYPAGEGREGDPCDPFLELAVLLYLNAVEALYPSGREIISVKELRQAHYFRDSHELKLTPLLKRFGRDSDGFKRAAEHLGGEPVDMADMAWRLRPFPRIPLYYLFWEADEEYPPRISVLFDRSIEECFSASGIWALVELTSRAMLKH
jgi:hypothetical protein